MENLQRQDLNPMEEAEGYQRLMKEYGADAGGGWPQQRRQIPPGRGQRACACCSCRRRSALCVAGRHDFAPGTPGRYSVSSRRPACRQAAAQKIVALAPVRAAGRKAMCKRMSAGGSAKAGAGSSRSHWTVDYVAECEKSLTRRLDRKVRIVNGKRKGRFELEFYGQEDLQRLYGRSSSPFSEKRRKSQ